MDSVLSRDTPQGTKPSQAESQAHSPGPSLLVVSDFKCSMQNKGKVSCVYRWRSSTLGTVPGTFKWHGAGLGLELGALSMLGMVFTLEPHP